MKKLIYLLIAVAVVVIESLIGTAMGVTRTGTVIMFPLPWAYIVHLVLVIVFGILVYKIATID